MTKTMRSLLVLTAAVTLAGTLAFAESGEATYKAKCVKLSRLRRHTEPRHGQDDGHQARFRSCR